MNTNSIITDDVSRAAISNLTMQVLPSGGQTDASSAIWWLKLEPMQEAQPGGARSTNIYILQAI